MRLGAGSGAMAFAHLSFGIPGFLDPEAVVADNVNALHGRALAEFLAAALAAQGYTASEIWPEDHGWDFGFERDNATYLIACNVIPDESGSNEAHVTWSRRRTLLDRLRGRNVLGAEDPSVAALRSIVSRLDGVTDLEFDLA